ncbi:hypothetical protein VNO78_31629 [Psophocarpus tetragonolobus]|uniref:Uncharacterized protein n=1 Tax=Psophocarpus tetragonolobus TaxID=3891 RepID=A0AAN9RYG9_PSOTE
MPIVGLLLLSLFLFSIVPIVQPLYSLSYDSQHNSDYVIVSLLELILILTFGAFMADNMRLKEFNVDVKKILELMDKCDRFAKIENLVAKLSTTNFDGGLNSNVMVNPAFQWPEN